MVLTLIFFRFSVEAENSLNNIHYRIVPPTRYEDVIRLLYGSFFTDEPMSKCLGLTDGIRRDPSNLDKKLTVTLLLNFATVPATAINITCFKRDQTKSVITSL